jgi:hypothetical protein
MSFGKIRSFTDATVWVDRPGRPEAETCSPKAAFNWESAIGTSFLKVTVVRATRCAIRVGCRVGLIALST